MKILIFNMNVIMSNCIKLYAQQFDSTENPTIQWSAIEHDLNLEKFLSIDSHILCKIIKLIEHFRRMHLPVTLTDNAKNIPGIIDSFDSDEQLSIINIDYFHSIYNNDMRKVFEFDEYDERSWVGHLVANQTVQEYIWVNFATSEIIAPELKQLDAVKDVNIHSLNFENDLPTDDTSTIIVCWSDTYIPYKFKFIWEVLTSIYSSEVSS